MVSWENTDLFLKHDGLPRTNKLAFKTWLINKYIMILHFKSAFCLIHQLLKKHFSSLVNSKNIRNKCRAWFVLQSNWTVKFLNAEMSGRKAAIESSEEWQQGQSDCSTQHPLPLVRIEGAQGSFCTFIDIYWQAPQFSQDQRQQRTKCKSKCSVTSVHTWAVLCFQGTWTLQGSEKIHQDMNLHLLFISPCTGEGMWDQKDISLQD